MEVSFFQIRVWINGDSNGWASNVQITFVKTRKKNWKPAVIENILDTFRWPQYIVHVGCLYTGSLWLHRGWCERNVCLDHDRNCKYRSSYRSCTWFLIFDALLVSFSNKKAVWSIDGSFKNDNGDLRPFNPTKIVSRCMKKPYKVWFLFFELVNLNTSVLEKKGKKEGHRKAVSSGLTGEWQEIRKNMRVRLFSVVVEEEMVGWLQWGSRMADRWMSLICVQNRDAEKNCKTCTKKKGQARSVPQNQKLS